MAAITPRQAGFRMPAEWVPHRAIWLAWPHDTTTFPDIPAAEKTFVEIIFAIHGSEQVELLVLDQRMQKHVAELLKAKQVDLNKVTFHQRDYADVWFRDYGPSFLIKEGELAMTNWDYNAYGKFPDLLKDDLIPDWMNTFLKLPNFKPGIVMEGGSFEVNGQGTVITTEQCLLNKNRNPKLTKLEIESYLKDYLGAEQVIWLKNGIENDHTDGHSDDLVRFVRANTILCAQEENPAKVNHAILKENWEILESARDLDGKPFKLVSIPMPEQYDKDGQSLAVSYANFYIGNKVVLMPTFAHKHDQEAQGILQSLFPERKVIGIDCRDLIYGGGTIHCVSQQEPETGVGRQ